MDFRLELHIKPWKRQIGLEDRLLLIGSCFTDHMSGRLRQHKFRLLENPNGIVFNPVSIRRSLESYLEPFSLSIQDLFQHQGVWHSWHHHGRFAHVDREQALQQMRTGHAEAAAFFPQCDWLIVTLGSAFVYELIPGTAWHAGDAYMPVANCHKVPASAFRHRLLTHAETVEALQDIVSTARRANAEMQVVFTISPVRHYREGLVENNRSKGLLHHAVMLVSEASDNVHYFPAYELVIDDLRDYRFYAEDMVHPNYQATRYVWDKFCAACIREDALQVMERIRRIISARQHRSLHPESEPHKTFLAAMLRETEWLAADFPWMDWSEELDYFRQGAA